MPSKASPRSQTDQPSAPGGDAAAPGTPQSFEQQLEELDAIVQRMESGELPLEESLREFERGQKLARVCQQTLEAAQQRVRTLLGEDATGNGPDTPDNPGGDKPAGDTGAVDDDDLPF